MRNLRRLAPEADFQAKWDESKSYASVSELEAAQRRYKKLRRFALQAAAVAAVPQNKRLRECLRAVHNKQGVQLVHSPSRQSAFYRGLNTCGSVWCCPICAAKVSERRRQQLGLGIKRWKEQGGAVWLLTLTFRHTKFDGFADLKGRFDAALKRLQSGQAHKDDKALFGIAGQVRALEVTHGKNGWHPHAHILLFIQGEDTKERRDWLQGLLFDRWERACRGSGLGLPTKKHGVRVDGGERAGEYVTKWGLESELTKHTVKVAHGKGRTPMAILSDWLDLGDQDDANLFAEYAEVMKGSQQLRWSKGLAKLLGMDDLKTDDEIAAEDEAQGEDVVMAGLSLAQWRVILKFDVRGQLLLLGARGDAEAVTDFVAYLEWLSQLRD